MSEKKYLEEMDEHVAIDTLVRGEINIEGQEQKFWALVSIYPSKYKELLEVQKSGTPYILSEYGDIKEYEIGSYNPNAEKMKYMVDNYGIDPHFEVRLTHELKQMAQDMKPE